MSRGPAAACCTPRARPLAPVPYDCNHGPYAPQSHVVSPSRTGPAGCPIQLAPAEQPFGCVPVPAGEVESFIMKRRDESIPGPDTVYQPLKCVPGNLDRSSAAPPGAAETGRLGLHVSATVPDNPACVHQSLPMWVRQFSAQVRFHQLALLALVPRAIVCRAVLRHRTAGPAGVQQDWQSAQNRKILGERQRAV
jgi:hypothetical protein